MHLNPYVDGKISKSWIYSGDCNIMYGGRFFNKEQVEAGEDWVEIVEVSEYPGCENRFIIQTGYVDFRHKNRPTLEQLESEFGSDIDSDDVVFLTVLFCSTDANFHETYVVQLGKSPDPYNTLRGSEPAPDYIAAHNANLLKFVKNRFLI